MGPQRKVPRAPPAYPEPRGGIKGVETALHRKLEVEG